MKILLLDNYDSFTYNLEHYLLSFEVEVNVVRNDQITVEEASDYDRFVLSPGPGLPSSAGVMNDLIRTYGTQKPMLGICLGMQAIAEVFGGKLLNLPEVCHGISSNTILKTPDALFTGFPTNFLTGRYHSWIVDASQLPDCFHVTAIDESNSIMALTHENQMLRGVQFHPESILTEFGMNLISNWLYHCN